MAETAEFLRTKAERSEASCGAECAQRTGVAVACWTDMTLMLLAFDGCSK